MTVVIPISPACTDMGIYRSVSTSLIKIVSGSYTTK
jgi:hypothetical protein